jgi:endopeptidase Clp ATP-binding regulatory subunit ClpX
MLIIATMSDKEYNIPNPKELEKEIGEFLTRKFGDQVKLVSPLQMQDPADDAAGKQPAAAATIHFDLRPEALIAHLDQYVVKQDQAKAILATKICTHFNRIRQNRENETAIESMVGSIKNNVLMMGPTGVGKTYIIKLIADKIGVPFVKGDATKFSETGYVGGDVEDLVRDLVKEADDDIELAQYGIIYIDEIDKIASSRNMVGADVSRTGVQRALLKPMEETEVDLKVPHDPIAMVQELERFRKTGKRETSSINTRNILFIVSGAFNGLVPIIRRRLSRKGIGFGAPVDSPGESTDILASVRTEDLIAFGFESEFVGRLPVRAVFEELNERDLFKILANPNNPIILGKKLDFAAYGIDIKFSETFLNRMAADAATENTGARGLVSAVERALLDFEKSLPGSACRQFPVTEEVIDHPQRMLSSLKADPPDPELKQAFLRLAETEKSQIREHLHQNGDHLSEKYKLTLTPAKIDLAAACYTRHIMDIGNAVARIKSYQDDIKKIELAFYQNHDINIVLEDDAIDLLIDMLVTGATDLDAIFKKLNSDFEHGLKLVREKTGNGRFFLTRRSLEDPESFIARLLETQEKPPR